MEVVSPGCCRPTRSSADGVNRASNPRIRSSGVAFLVASSPPVPRHPAHAMTAANDMTSSVLIGSTGQPRRRCNRPDTPAPFSSRNSSADPLVSKNPRRIW
ncbi:MAG: hypothetical protein MZV64_16640 [Ignavibacteriales bacterium]|nr:hypothetical protein [Ignavibacteriales bacterium]